MYLDGDWSSASETCSASAAMWKVSIAVATSSMCQHPTQRQKDEKIKREKDQKTI